MIEELIKKYEKKINHYEEKYSDTAVINFSEIAEWKAYQEILQDLNQLKEEAKESLKCDTDTDNVKYLKNM